MTEGVILCEGYHDRAFWSGLLEKLGCKDARTVNGGALLKDPGGIRLEKGAFGFLSTGGCFIRVIPCLSRDKVTLEFKQYIIDRVQKPVKWIIVNVDADCDWNVPPAEYRKPRIDSAMNVVTKAGAAAVLRDDLITIDGGLTTIGISIWSCHDKDREGVPRKQTLERIICSSIVAVYPDRGPHVQQFLAGRPHPPAPDPKEQALSHLAGWYAKNGTYETICGELWKDSKIAAELEARLKATGVWAMATEMAHLQEN